MDADVNVVVLRIGGSAVPRRGSNDIGQRLALLIKSMCSSTFSTMEALVPVQMEFPPDRG